MFDINDLPIMLPMKINGKACVIIEQEEYFDLLGYDTEELSLEVLVELCETNDSPSAWRNWRKMTQAELAKAVGVSVAQIEAIEKGGDYPVSLLRKIADVLKIDPAYLAVSVRENYKQEADNG